MTVDPDTTRSVRSWLHADGHESADRVLQAVLDALDTTPQRRASRWPAWQFPSTTVVRRLGLASALVAVVALLAFNVVSTAPGVGADPSATPGPTPSAAPSLIVPGQVVQPEVVIPPGVTSTQTAEEVAQKMLDVIAVNERAVGRALAPPRIIRIQLLKPGDVYYARRLDGSSGVGLSWSRGGPSWAVEAVGTFIDPIGRDGGVATSIGTHGVYVWGDGGSWTYDWFPCWVRTSEQYHANEMEGQCEPPSQ